MSTWYRVDTCSQEITPVTVAQETSKMIVVVRPATEYRISERRRTPKKSMHGAYYPTFEQAKEALQKRLRDSIARLRRSLAHTEEDLKKLDATPAATEAHDEPPIRVQRSAF